MTEPTGGHSAEHRPVEPQAGDTSTSASTPASTGSSAGSAESPGDQPTVAEPGVIPPVEQAWHGQPAGEQTAYLGGDQPQPGAYRQQAGHPQAGVPGYGQPGAGPGAGYGTDYGVHYGAGYGYPAATQQFANPGVDAKQHRNRRLRTAGLFAAVAIGGAVLGGLAVAAVAPWGGSHGGVNHVVQARPGHPGGQGGVVPRHGGGANGAQVVTGTVVSAQSDKLVITQSNGQQVTETVTPQTRVRGNGKAAITDLKPGDHVVLRVNSSNQVLGVLVQ